MEKALRIEAFRNIGFKNKKPKTERVVLSHSLNKGEIGDLVILIGANNSGKTNVLEALNIYGNSEITERDITDLFLDQECKAPSLTLSYKNDKGDQEYALTKKIDEKIEVNYPKGREGNSFIELKYAKKEDLFDEIDRIASAVKSYFEDTFFIELLESVDFERLPDSDFQKLLLESFLKLEEIVNQDDYLDYYSRNFTNYLQDNSNLYHDYIEWKEKQSSDLEILKERFKSKFGYEFNSKISYYKEREISNKNLSCSPDEIEKSFFFSKLMNSIDVQSEEILEAYRLFVNQNNRGVLTQLEKKINKKLEKIASDFNKLYYLEKDRYSFNITLESGAIYFEIFRNEQALSLDYQSTGFRWFFNLYFGLLNTIELNVGDIIIMDEPEMHLHPRGQKELRQFLKKFAINNDITIVIATHSPFLIDLDYLDELRIIENKDNITSITNNFAAVNNNDPDSLIPIKSSLTVDNHVICDPEKKVIFVEGITDYNYLVTFKKKLKQDDLIFIPINGLGKSKEENIKISKRLIEIGKNNPILLVDGDTAGKNMEAINANSELEIISLGDISDRSFKTIEDLFTEEDFEKFRLDKHASTSSLFKKKILFKEETLSEETEKNFRILFEKMVE